MLIVLSPQVWPGADSAAPLPLGNPAIVTVPLGFLACILGSLLTGRDEVTEASFDEVGVRSTTGIGSERASSPAEPQSPRPLANQVSS